MFSCEYCDIFKNTYFIEDLQWLLERKISRSVVLREKVFLGYSELSGIQLRWTPFQTKVTTLLTVTLLR